MLESEELIVEKHPPIFCFKPVCCSTVQKIPETTRIPVTEDYPDSLRPLKNKQQRV